MTPDEERELFARTVAACGGPTMRHGAIGRFRSWLADKLDGLSRRVRPADKRQPGTGVSLHNGAFTFSGGTYQIITGGLGKPMQSRVVVVPEAGCHVEPFPPEDK